MFVSYSDSITDFNGNIEYSFRNRMCEIFLVHMNRVISDIHGNNMIAEKTAFESTNFQLMAPLGDREC